MNARYLAFIAVLFSSIALGADVKISALPAGAALSGTEELPAVQSAATVKTTPLAFNTYMDGLSHSWSGTTNTIVNSEPRLLLNESDQGSDEKLWDWDCQTKVCAFRTRTDADGAGVNAIAITRGTGTAITNVSLGNATNNPTGTWLGTGTFTFGGAVISPTRFSFSGTSTASGTGVYSNSTNQVSVSAGSNQVTVFSTAGVNVTDGILRSTDTTFTASGCSVSTLVGGSFAGRFTSGTTGTCTVTITPGTTVGTGYTCYAADLTTPVIFTQTASTTTTCTVSATTVSGDIVTFMAIGY